MQLKTQLAPGGGTSQSNGESFTLWEHSDLVSNKHIRRDNMAGHIKSRTNCSKDFSDGMLASFDQNLGQAYHTGVSFGSPIELKEQIKRERYAQMMKNNSEIMADSDQHPSSLLDFIP